LSGESRSPTLEELLALKEGLRRLPGWKTAAEIRALDRSRRLFDGNVEELQRFLGEHSQPPRVLELWAMDNRENFDLFLEEVDRLAVIYGSRLQRGARSLLSEFAPVSVG
jgi:hypothetical protein